MKKIIICAALALSATFFVKDAAAQIRFNVHVNIGSQPVWGPTGYDYAEYYYLPDIETYYYVPTHQFIYMNGGRWVFSRSLPYRYRNYNLYSGYKVVVNEPRAYMHFNDQRATILLLRPAVLLSGLFKVLLSQRMGNETFLFIGNPDRI